MPELLYILDLLGVAAFATVGAYAALQHKYDIIGIIACALITALGGGTIRALLLQHQPVYFHDSMYLVIVVFGIIFAIVFYRYLPKWQTAVLVVDAIGLATFALIGAQLATSEGLAPAVVILLAVVTAVGGGLLRDIAMRLKPQIFFRDFYATPALILGVLYSMFPELQNNPGFIYGLVIMTFTIRMAALRYSVEMWKPWINS